MKCNSTLARKALAGLFIIAAGTYTVAQPMAGQLPEEFKGYRLTDYAGKIDENELYTSYFFAYQKSESQKRKDYIKVAFRIYHDPTVYKQEVESFSMEDAFMTYSSMNLEDLTDQENLMGQITQAMKNPEETPESAARSDQDTLDDLDVKELNMPNYTSGHYRFAPNPSGNDNFRAVITWGADRYVAVNATAANGETLNLDEILEFIKAFPFTDY